MPSVRAITNNAAYAIVNAAYKQAVGDAAVDTLTLDDFADGGVAFDSLSMGRDQFMKGLIDQISNFYTDTAYTDEYQDLYYVDSARFGSIIQAISVKAPEVEASHSWKNLAPVYNSSTHQYDKVTIGTYDVTPPEVVTSYYTKSNAWELPISISEEQITTAFKSGEELRNFVDYVFIVIENALLEHLRTLNDASRNAYMAEKILYAGSQGAQGVHVVNLLTKYNAERGGNLATVDAFFADPAACRYAAAQLQLYEKYMRQQTTLFNTKGLVKFCPKDRLVLEVNSYFENALNETAYSTTFHDELVALPNYRSTPAWQGMGVTDALASTEAASFAETSKIDVSVATGDVNKSGIVALMVDKYAILHTIKQDRVASQYFSPEDLWCYWYQHKDMYCQNLGQNGIVFTIEAPSAGGGGEGGGGES